MFGPLAAAALALLQAVPAGAADESKSPPTSRGFPNPSAAIQWAEMLRTDGMGSSGCKADTHQSFLDALHYWRTARRIYVGYDGSRYDLPALQWTQSSFIQPQAMEDRYLYDPIADKYTVDRYLADVNQRYGGIDSILLWPVYPNIGIDDRNQLDSVAQCQAVLRVCGNRSRLSSTRCRVLFPAMMWDLGTHDPGEALVAGDCRADGGDWCRRRQRRHPGWSTTCFHKGSRRHGPSPCLSTELSAGDEALAWDLGARTRKVCAICTAIYRFKWLETRHMANLGSLGPHQNGRSAG